MHIHKYIHISCLHMSLYVYIYIYVTGLWPGSSPAKKGGSSASRSRRGSPRQEKNKGSGAWTLWALYLKD